MSARTTLIRRTDGPPAPAAGRPILLITLGTPVSPVAASVAMGAATDAGSPLILANVTRLEPLSLSIVLGYDALEELTPETSGSLRDLAERASASGLDVERLRVRSPRPATAIVELVSEIAPALVVLGSDPADLPRRRFDRVATVLRERVTILVWLPE